METILNKSCEIVIDKSYENIKISEYDKVLIITDENVSKQQLDKFKVSFDRNNEKISHHTFTYTIKPGEESKSIQTYEEIMKICIEKSLSRKSAIVALGGGVVGDLAGFVASTYMRGIDVIQVPTTLLAQVDSSIGGKTGINIGNYKNIMGSFHQPKLTYINVQALKTLPIEEFQSAMSEVIKYGVIYDYELLLYLDKNSEHIINRKEEYIYEIVKECALIKSHIVQQDEKENGIRKILNFGHTFGHGVEKLMSINHGNSVSIGMNMAFKLALKESMIDEKYYNKFKDICDKYSLPTHIHSEELEIENMIFNIMQKDKKNSFGSINLILPIEKSKVCEVNNISKDKIIEIIKESNYA